MTYKSHLAGASEARFAFGENWLSFLKELNDDRVLVAVKSLQGMLERQDFLKLRCLDIGSGSGLFSLAMRHLGAEVHSFDLDQNSVSATQQLKSRFYPSDPQWTVEQGSVLDEHYLKTLGSFDIVYAWGVLHHTGDLKRACANAARLVRDQGVLFLAIYNDQGRTSGYWKKIKELYNKSPEIGKKVLLGLSLVRLWGPTLMRDALRLKPLSSWRNYIVNRGMSPWRDVVDWVGGYPFEVAKPEDMLELFQEHGFVLRKLKTCGGGLGCNEFVLVKTRCPTCTVTSVPVEVSIQRRTAAA